MTQQQDATALLAQDHRKVEQLFAEYERQAGTLAPDAKRRLVERMAQELRVHAAIEEEVFYPSVRRNLREGDQLADEAVHEHAEVKQALADLERLRPGGEGYDAKVAELIREVRHHVEEEEGELFPKLRQALGEERLAAMGAELAEAKRAARA